MLTLIICFAVAVADQVTKFLISWNMPVGGRISVVPGFFQLRYIRNTGAAWGMFSGFNNWLVVLSIIMIAVLVVFRRSLYTDGVWSRIGLGLLGGGIVGNLVDRIKLGYVVDFFDFYLGKSHFPAFNIADSAICVGVGIYMFLQIKVSHDEHKAAKSKQNASRPADHTEPA